MISCRVHECTFVNKRNCLKYLIHARFIVLDWIFFKTLWSLDMANTISGPIKTSVAGHCHYVTEGDIRAPHPGYYLNLALSLPWTASTTKENLLPVQSQVCTITWNHVIGLLQQSQYKVLCSHLNLLWIIITDLHLVSFWNTLDYYSRILWQPKIQKKQLLSWTLRINLNVKQRSVKIFLGYLCIVISLFIGYCCTFTI